MAVCAVAATLASAASAAAFGPLTTIGSPGNAAGELSFPSSVAIGPNGHLYVPDNGQSRINEFQPDGSFVRAWGWGVDTGAAALETCTTVSTCQNGIAGGGAPAVRVQGPDGEVLESVPDEVTAGQRLRVLAYPKCNATWVGVDDAQPGTYTITPLPGSVAITGMSETRPEDDTLKALVTGQGDERVVHYDVGKAGGQLVRFFERGEATWHEIGKATSGEGEIRFTPAPGPSGKREIVAQIEVDELAGPAVTVAEFKAPPAPKAGAVKKVRARRAGKRLLVSWKAAKNAASYNIVVRMRNGLQRVAHASGKRTRVSLRGVPQTQSGVVGVAAVGPLTDRGKAGSGRFKATKDEPDRRGRFR